MSAKGWKVEYSKSGRASCKACRGPISKGVVRFARMMQSRHFDGLEPHWHHAKCFWAKNAYACPGTAHLLGFDDLRPKDQQDVAKKFSSAVVKEEEGGPLLGCPELKMELAKSSRSMCRKCEVTIEKGELRLAVVMPPDPDSRAPFPTPWWYHRRCFPKALAVHTDVPLAKLRPEHFAGHKSVDKSLLEDVFNLLESARSDAGLPTLGKGKGKKRKAEATAPVPDKKPRAAQTAEEKALKQQANLLWKFKDQLKKIGNPNIRTMLAANGQLSSGGESTILDRAANGLAFGRLAACKQCGNVEWHMKPDGFHCNGKMDAEGYEVCDVVTTTPPRAAWIIPPHLQDTDEFRKYKYKKRARVFRAAAKDAMKDIEERAAADAAAATALAAAADDSMDVDDGTVFSGLKIRVAFAGKLLQTLAALKKQATALGGSVITGKLGSHVTCLITNQAEIDKQSKKIKEAEKFGVPMVAEAWLTQCAKEKKCTLMQPHVLKATATVLEPSQEKFISDTLISKSSGLSKSLGKSGGKVKLIVKGRSTVDPESGCAADWHVKEEGSTIWNASLSLVDMRSKVNSYYKLQLLEHDSRKLYRLFRSWGRVGTSIGGQKVDSCGSLQQAKAQFNELFFDKTGNRFGATPYKKMPYKFLPLDVEYDDPKSKASSRVLPKANPHSKLAPAVQDLVRLLFDVEAMKQVMKEFEIDLTKMPLGKLSKRQLEGSLAVLSTLQGVIDDDLLPADAKKRKVLANSTKFYEMIPHDFGTRQPPLIADKDILVSKIRMVESLLDLEVAARILEDAGGAETSDPLEAHYRKLKTDLVPLAKDSEEFGWIREYMQNTHASTHRSYDLELQEVFQVTRHGQKDKKDKKFQRLHNRRLLWHGSRRTNFVGILSEGLRIAPPSAPVTGYMFGKGVYFADMVSKSANYCFCSATNDTGFLLLSEVVLGTMYERLHAEYVTKLPAGKHSTWGQGQTHPDPKGMRVLDNGTIVPMGKATRSGLKSSLLYNEHIVYDTAQIKMKYMLKCKFKYRSRW